MSKVKYNFAIGKFLFGDYWVGKTKLEVNNKSIFSTFEEAIEEAIDLTDSISERDELECTEEEDIEIIEPEIERWIIK